MNMRNPYSFLVFVAISSLLVNLSSCLNLKLLNASLAGRGFSHGVATWYGSRTGAGNDAGACGYKDTVSQPPLNSFIASEFSNVLYKEGHGCGTCYQVVCSQHPSCSRKPVTITITDQCNGGCGGEGFHFDLSGTAFGALAKRGQADTLLNAGRLNIGFRRAACNYKSWKIAFHVDAGSNPSYLAFLTEYEDGDGDLGFVEVLPATWRQWVPMQQSWGATWRANLPNGAKGPFSIRLTTVESRRTLVAHNAIPVNWAPGQTYWSNANF